MVSKLCINVPYTRFAKIVYAKPRKSYSESNKSLLKKFTSSWISLACSDFIAQKKQDHILYVMRQRIHMLHVMRNVPNTSVQLAKMQRSICNPAKLARGEVKSLLKKFTRAGISLTVILLTWKNRFICYMLWANHACMDPGQSMDCPEQTVHGSTLCADDPWNVPCRPNMIN